MFPVKIHRALFLFGVFSLAFGMMIGAVPTSVPQFFLLGNWIIEGQFKKKWASLKTNTLFWALEAIFLLHLAGLLYTQDLQPGLNDIQIKLPLMILPLVFLSTERLNETEIKITLWSFLAGCLVNTLWCLNYSFILHHNETLRNTSRFMSHIRLGLYLNMAIVITMYFYRSVKSSKLKAGYLVLVVYFVAVMYLLGLASGVIILFLLVLFGGAIIVLKQQLVFKLGALVCIVAASCIVFSYVRKISNEQLQTVDSKNNRPLKQTASGNFYIHFDTVGQKENGYFIHINIQLEELKRSWQKRCPADSFSFPPHPHNLTRYGVLIRYMASKGLTKDSSGVAQLTDSDIRMIQNNVPNYAYNSWPYLHQRIYELANEYDNFVSGRNINGNSVTMRFYFWKAAWYSIRQHPVFGVGTGDVQSEMTAAYEHSHSPLLKEWYKRPHNQLLTFTVALGGAGLLIILVSLIYPVLVLKRYLNLNYYCFLFVVIISFLTEDTIETQAGATFFAFFTSLFITEAYFKKKQNPEG